MTFQLSATDESCLKALEQVEQNNKNRSNRSNRTNRSNHSNHTPPNRTINTDVDGYWFNNEVDNSKCNKKVSQPNLQLSITNNDDNKTYEHNENDPNSEVPTLELIVPINAEESIIVDGKKIK